MDEQTLRAEAMAEVNYYIANARWRRISWSYDDPEAEVWLLAGTLLREISQIYPGQGVDEASARLGALARHAIRVERDSRYEAERHAAAVKKENKEWIVVGLIVVALVLWGAGSCGGGNRPSIDRYCEMTRSGQVCY